MTRWDPLRQVCLLSLEGLPEPAEPSDMIDIRENPGTSHEHPGTFPHFPDWPCYCWRGKTAAVVGGMREGGITTRSSWDLSWWPNWSATTWLLHSVGQNTQNCTLKGWILLYRKYIYIAFLKSWSQDFLVVKWLRLSTPGAWIQSLVGELRSHKPCCAAKIKISK